MASNWPDSELRQRVARARRLLNAKDWPEAEKEIEEGLGLYPETAVLLALAADLSRKMRKLAEAESYLKRAEAADPAHEQVISVGADLAFDGRDYERAAALYRQLLDRRPTSYHTSRYVQALNRLERCEESSQAARQGLERYPDDPWLLGGLAAAEAKRGRIKEAIDLYERLLELKPKDRFAYKELMRLRTADTPAEQAADSLRGLMRSGDRGKNPHLKTLAADRLRSAGKFQEAITEYEASLGLRPGDPYALRQLGFCYRKLGQNDKAFEILKRAFAADPANRYVRTSLQSICRETDRLGELADLVEEALKLHPEVKSLFGMLRKLQKNKKNY